MDLMTKTRIEYTVIGATVNLASRMESNAPVGGILVTSDTRAAASPDFLFGDAVEISAKGYEKSIQAFELKG